MPSTPHMNSYFDDFLKRIRLTDSQKSALVEAHNRLRDELAADSRLDGMLVSTFLQGSYRRSTIIKPAAGQSSDVDVVVVTNINENEYTPDEALDLFTGFLEENYPKQFERQGRSWGIHANGVDIDLVPTSAPSEALSKSRALNDAVFSSLDVESATSQAALSKIYGSRTAVNINSILENNDWKGEALRIPDREAGVWE